MDTMGGLAEIAINGTTIPASLLSEVTVELTEGTRERSTLAGKFTRPSGTLETATATFTMYLPSIDYLKDLFPSRYNAGTAPQVTGNVIWDSASCVTADPAPFNIHYVCETNDNNDIHFFAGVAQLNFNPTYNGSDDVTIEVTVHAQPDANGRVYRLGTGDLTANSIFDATTGATVPVATQG